ncbi:MAG TPA: hypothetical protein VMF03_22145 [Steroidobacteraceae bacterium]|nr:hypothetical protein [Steroidobacteraceae bacterium]
MTVRAAIVRPSGWLPLALSGGACCVVIGLQVLAMAAAATPVFGLGL